MIILINNIQQLQNIRLSYTGLRGECHNHRVANLVHPQVRVLTNFVVEHSGKHNLNCEVTQKH